MHLKAIIPFFCLIGFLLFNRLLLLPSNPTLTLLPVLLAAQTVFLLPATMHLKSGWSKGIMLLVFMVPVVYIPYSQSRAAWLAFIAGMLLQAYIKGKFSGIRIKMVMVVGLISMMLALAFGFKTGSTNGRLLVYRVIASHVTPNDLVSGIGAGKFKASYNIWQADYFTTQSINGKQALLADNTYYAFNDYLQLVVENGLPGICIIAILFFCFAWLLKLVRQKSSVHPLACGALSSIFAIAVAAICAYPFQNGWILVHVIFCFLLAACILVGRKWLQCIIVCTGIVVAIFIGHWQMRMQQYDRLNAKAALHSQMGSKKEALQLLEHAIRNGCTYGNTLFLYARELFYSGNTIQALYWLHRAAGKIINQDVINLFAIMYEETGQLKLAEKCHLAAVYMIPNRFESRYKLVGFYLRHKQYETAASWKAITLNLPVKIPSEKVELILQRLNN
jgi:tetratricopeptide (TPR) repeat protein